MAPPAGPPTPALPDGPRAAVSVQGCTSPPIPCAPALLHHPRAVCPFLSAQLKAPIQSWDFCLWGVDLHPPPSSTNQWSIPLLSPSHPTGIRAALMSGQHLSASHSHSHLLPWGPIVSIELLFSPLHCTAARSQSRGCCPRSAQLLSPKSAQELQGITAGQRDGAAGSCAYLSRRGSAEEQQLLPTSISCKDLQHKGTKIPLSTSLGHPGGRPQSTARGRQTHREEVLGMRSPTIKLLLK